MTSPRPRPVTATVTKLPGMEPVTSTPIRRASLSSGGSTTSLTDVLNNLTESETLLAERQISVSGGSTASLLSILAHSSCKSFESLEDADKTPCVSDELSGPSSDGSSHLNRYRSRSSTASLVSVLDHESCESVSSSDSEAEQKENKKDEVSYTNTESQTETKTDQITSASTQTNTRTSTTRTSTRTRSKSETDSSVETQSKSSNKPEKDASVLAWEQWMVEKAKQLRIEQEKKAAKLKQEKEEEERKQKEKEEKQKKVDQEVQLWIEKKQVQQKVQKKMENQRMKTEQELKEQQKKEIEEKADKKYHEWLEEKKRLRAEEKKKQKEKQKVEEEKEKEKKQKSEEAYQKWLKEAYKRPQCAKTNYGYVSGKLKGYYDANVNPPPSFYNPLPWVPIEVPPQKSETPRRSKSAKTRYVWNPNKYL